MRYKLAGIIASEHRIRKIDKFIQSCDHFIGERWVELCHLDSAKHEGISVTALEKYNYSQERYEPSPQVARLGSPNFRSKPAS